MCPGQFVNSGNGSGLWKRLSQTTRDSLLSLYRSAGQLGSANAAAPPVADDDAARPKKPRSERCRSQLTRLPQDVLRTVLSYRDLPTRYACACANRALQDTVASLPLGPERFLAQRRHPLLATVCDVGRLDAKTLGDLVGSQKDTSARVGSRVPAGRTNGEAAPLHPATMLDHVFSLELTVDGAATPLYLGTAEWGEDGYDPDDYQVTFLIAGPDARASMSQRLQAAIAAGKEIRARVMVERRVNGGFQCSMLMDTVVRMLNDGVQVLFQCTALSLCDAVRKLEESNLVKASCVGITIRYMSDVPEEGISLKFTVLDIDENSQEVEDGECFDETDMGHLLDYYIPWSRHVANVPPAGSYHLVMFNYARNAAVPLIELLPLGPH